MTESITLKPQEGPQELFLSSCADIVVYGGAAGGGKSFALLLECMRHISTIKGFGATIFRKTSPQIRNEGGLWDESRKLFAPLGADPVESILKWKFPPFGNAVKFAHLDHEKDVHNYQGSQIPLIGFDELTHFSESQFFYMLSRNRSTCGVKPYVRATTNPDSDSWLGDFIDWWIDKEGYPIKEHSGIVRYFARINDVIEWGDSADELIEKHPAILSHESPPKSFTFISATLEDNKILMKKDPAYKANLMALPRVQREQLLGGNWKVRASAGDYFPEEKANIIDAVPSDIKTFCRGWDLAATEPSETNKSPDSTSGIKIGITSSGDIIIIDRKNKKINSNDVENLLKNTASTDGKKCKIRLPQDPGQAGKSQAKRLTKLLHGYPVKTLPVSGDKEVRSGALSAQWHAGNVYLVRGDWNKAYLKEMNDFPLGPHDDDVDASNDAYDELASKTIETKPLIMS